MGRLERLETGDLLQITDDDGADSHPSWSPDGRRIAYGAASDAAPYGNLDIYVMNADGRENRRLTTDPGIDRTPAWSPVPLPESFLPSAVEVQSRGAIKKARRR